MGLKCTDDTLSLSKIDDYSPMRMRQNGFLRRDAATRYTPDVDHSVLSSGTECAGPIRVKLHAGDAADVDTRSLGENRIVANVDHAKITALTHCKQVRMQGIPSSALAWFLEGIEEEFGQCTIIADLVSRVAGTIHENQLMRKRSFLQVARMPDGTDDQDGENHTKRCYHEEPWQAS